MTESAKIASASGKCLCGAITFEAKAVDTHIHSCHCNMCRNWSGGPLLSALAASLGMSGE